jgi:hypothetical protein
MKRILPWITLALAACDGASLEVDSQFNNLPVDAATGDGDALGDGDGDDDGLAGDGDGDGLAGDGDGDGLAGDGDGDGDGDPDSELPDASAPGGDGDAPDAASVESEADAATSDDDAGTASDDDLPYPPIVDAGPDETACNGAGLLGHPLEGFDYPEFAGFTLCLVEEFEAALDVRGGDSIWTYSDGALFEGQVRHSAEGLSFADGKMHITISEDPSPVSWSWAANSYIPARSLRSGELRTKYNNFRYGRYEVRMRAPDHIGNFIATMFTFRTPGFQQWREIDVEVLGNLPNGLLTNLIVADDTTLWNPGIEEPAYS